MIFHDNGYGITQDSLKYFREHLDDIGPIVGVSMCYYYEDGNWIKYPFRIVGEENEVWLSGCGSGYGGEGPHGSVAVLKELGYPEPYCNWPLNKASFQLGPPDNPEPEPEPLPEIELGDAHHEILDIVREYQSQHDEMPAIREIAELADLSTSNTVWRYLDELEQAGQIERKPHTARAIKLLV